MTPLPAALAGRAGAAGAAGAAGPAGGELVAWRLDRADRAGEWASGEGARLYGGRWNPQGQRAVYLSLDPSTTILEKAVHGGFALLDRVPHVLTAVTVVEPDAVQVVQPEQIPKPEWRGPGALHPAQQAYGARLLAAHGIIVIPSVVSRQSWNMVCDPAHAAGRVALKTQLRFELDRRLRSQA